MVRTPAGLGDGSHLFHAGGAPADSEPEPNQDLWRQFAQATSFKAWCQSWLSLQCRLLPGIKSAVVLLGPPDRGPFTPAAVWPNPSVSVVHLTRSAERSLKERRGLLIKNDSPPDSADPVSESHHVAYPIEVSGKLHGVVVLEVEPHTGQEVQSIMRQLHWGTAWIEVMIRRAETMQFVEVNERLQKVLDLVASIIEQEDFHAAAMAFVTKLATALECDRVGLGFVEKRHVRVRVLSHSAEFGKQTNLVRAIGSTMDEAVDQRAIIIYPVAPDAAPLVIRAHEELSRQHGAGSICTIPFENKGEFFGGLTLERSADKPFDGPTVELCETAVALAGPILRTKQAEERWLVRKAGDSLAVQLKKLLGPGHLARKLIVIAVLGLVVFFSLFKIDYRVTAPVTIEGAIKRAIAAPFNGYIKEAPIRPGDVVKEGERLCLLDDRDLTLERVKRATEREQFVKQYHEAMAKHDRSQIRIIKAKIDQAEAQVALLDEQLVRTKIAAPFDGIVMSGDLSQSLGAPVERGQVLFEVAPLDSYRVIAEVDERDIIEIGVGQRSEVLLPSMPGRAFPFVVDKITPVSTAKEGRNAFRVEAHIEKGAERLRPGMEGIGKIKIDRRKLIWVWTHDIIDWLRLKLWRWWP